MSELKLGIIHYNFPNHSLSEFLRAIKKIGYAYSEIRCTDFRADDPDADAEAEKLRKEMDALGLKPSSVSLGNDFVVLDEAVVAAQVERTKRIARLAKMLGTNVLRTEGGRPKPEVPEAKWCDAMAGCLKRLVPFLEEEDVYLAVDNHGKITNDGELQARLFEAVGSKHVGANLDTMNYRATGHYDLETVYKFHRMMAPYALHTHFKDGVLQDGKYRGTELGSGELDLSIAVAALKEAGYDGVWTVEYEKMDGDREEGARKSLAHLKKLLAG
ncbi:MAG: sugar phosphate isomerase/epimerase [Kiritimatiellae bacterium]|nr:sugar phosphate isomerase/epimerase [Kiritimatiellia bacterium]